MRPKSQPICNHDSTGVIFEPSISVHLTGISAIGMFNTCAMYNSSTSNALKTNKVKVNTNIEKQFNVKLQTDYNFINLHKS